MSTLGSNISWNHRLSARVSTTMANKKEIKKRTTKKVVTNLNKDLEVLREKILNSSWHHMQTESSVKELFAELIDVLKKHS